MAVASLKDAMRVAVLSVTMTVVVGESFLFKYLLSSIIFFGPFVFVINNQQSMPRLMRCFMQLSSSVWFDASVDAIIKLMQRFYVKMQL